MSHEKTEIVFQLEIMSFSINVKSLNFKVVFILKFNENLKVNMNDTKFRHHI